jgi:hypothetical protein
MNLPFTHDQFLDLFAAYNEAVWPVLIALWTTTAVVVARLYLGSGDASRTLTGLLVFHWAWSGAVYHLIYFRRINSVAVFFGAGFLVQAALFLWRGFGSSGLVFDAQNSKWRVPGLLLILYSLAYPGIGLALGLHAPRWPSFGVPCPTTVFTLGVLMLAPRREARFLGIVPILWATIGGSAAFVLRVRADLILPLAGVLLLAYMLSNRNQQARAP